MYKYRNHETHLMHAAVWSGVAIVLTLLGAVAWGIVNWGNLPSPQESATAFGVLLGIGWLVILWQCGRMSILMKIWTEDVCKHINLH